MASKKEDNATFYQLISKDVMPRVKEIEGDLAKLVGIIGEESTSRRVFEEKVSNAIEQMAKTNNNVSKLAEGINSLEKYMITKLATVEDRDKLHERIDGVITDIRTVEDNTNKNSWITSGVERFGWIIVVALVSLAGFFMRG